MRLTSGDHSLDGFFFLIHLGGKCETTSVLTSQNRVWISADPNEPRARLLVFLRNLSGFGSTHLQHLASVRWSLAMIGSQPGGWIRRKSQYCHRLCHSVSVDCLQLTLVSAQIPCFNLLTRSPRRFVSLHSHEDQSHLCRHGDALCNDDTRRCETTERFQPAEGKVDNMNVSKVSDFSKWKWVFLGVVICFMLGDTGELSLLLCGHVCILFAVTDLTDSPGRVWQIPKRSLSGHFAFFPPLPCFSYNSSVFFSEAAQSNTHIVLEVALMEQFCLSAMFSHSSSV